MMPVLWLQHEINNSYIFSTKNEKSINIKYPSEEQFRETKNFEFYLFGILLLVRTLLPRKNDWCLKSSLDLLMHDIIYIHDALDFISILFDDSKKSIDQTFETLILWCLAYISCYFSLNLIYRPSRIHISEFYNGNLNLFEKIELKLAYDSFVRFIVPSLFYEIPMILFRSYIFYSNGLIEWKNSIFLLKNILSIILNIIIYFEIRHFKNESVFYSYNLV
jgi:hypothetical protein